MIHMTQNRKPFYLVCDCNFGRKVIYTNENSINSSNVIAELDKALPIHENNAEEIAYLDRYYRGDQPVLYRRKKNRPEINNKVVVNVAQFIVDTKSSEVSGEPIQYVLRGTDENKAEQIRELIAILDSEDKAYYDIELCRWRSICGTAYRYIGNDDSKEKPLDESPFFMTVENPCNTFVVYHSDTHRPAFSCQIRTDANNNKTYLVFTNSLWFKITNNDYGKTIIESGINGNGAIPVVEYPNNARRLSDIEITISLTDEINKLACDRANSIEGFVSSWIKFINCEIDIKKFRELREEGFFSVTSNNAENKSDVDIMSSELNQSETQVAVNDLFEKLLIIQGIASRERNTGGDTGSAVELRNGHTAEEQRAQLNENIFKKSERLMLKIIINRLRITNGFSITPSDVEVKITRSKTNNMLTKAETLQILLSCGIDNARAIKTVGLFSDPEQVAYESKERMDTIFTKDVSQSETLNQ